MTDLMKVDPVRLTQECVRCKSVTPEDAGAQKVLTDALEPMGFESHWMTFEGRGGSYPVQNVFTRLGTDGPHLCFAGHTDVVPAGDDDAWSVPPFSAEIVDGKMIGRGTSDMKGNICAFIAAVSEYLEEYGKPKGSISLLITGDEEAEALNGTVRVLDWMEAQGHIPDVALVGEPSNRTALGQEIKIGRRGSLNGTLVAEGVQGHVANPHRARNPLPDLVKLMDALASYHFDEGSESFPPTNLEIVTIDVGNTANNIIPARGTAKFNIRFSDHWTSKTLEKRVREILDSVGSEDYDLQVSCNAESFITERGDWTDLVTNTVTRMTNRTPELSTSGGTSDARFISNYCPVVEFGLLNATIHQVDEHLMVDDLLALTRIYKDILVQYFS